MKRNRPPKLNAMVVMSALLALMVACGGTAPAAPQPTDATVAQPTTVPGMGQTPQPTSAPEISDRALPTSTPIPVGEATPTLAPATAKPSGTINAGWVEVPRFSGHPMLSETPATNLTMGAPMGEALIRLGVNGEHQGWLLDSWSISEDYTTWTLNLRQGVQFHKGYGEMTAEDVIWSYTEGWAQNRGYSRVENVLEFWANPGGSVEAPDPHTIVVDTGPPLSEIGVKLTWMMPSANASWIASKRQTEEVGVEAADLEPALTGPWELVEDRIGEYWKMRAVEDHWRQTPYFEELVIWNIPEESSRLAGFQTGNLDTFAMSYDSIPLVQSVPGARLMRLPGGPTYILHFYGNWLVEAEAGEPQPAWDPELPWVSASADVNSEEWKRAVKVRQALIMAIDRQAILDTILSGYARLGTLRGFRHHEDLLGDRHWEYNPDRARQLLDEAGYSDGFSIPLAPTIRGAPGEIELCEAIADMWETELGLDVQIQRVAWDALVPKFRARTYVGAVCQGGSSKVDVTGIGTVLLTTGAHSHGATHPFIEGIIPRFTTEIDEAKREAMEAEYGTFLFDNAFAEIALFYGDVVWPVGPRIEEWDQYVNASDLRSMGGYEYIQHRR